MLVCMAVLLELQRRPPGLGISAWCQQWHHLSMNPWKNLRSLDWAEQIWTGAGVWSGRAFQEQGQILSHCRLTEHSMALEPQCTHLGKLIPLLQLPGATSCCFCLLQSERGSWAGGGLHILAVQEDTCQGKKQVDFKSITMHLTKLTEQEEGTKKTNSGQTAFDLEIINIWDNKGRPPEYYLHRIPPQSQTTL